MIALSLPSRCLEAELMDDPALDPMKHEQALRGVRRINRLSFAARTSWRAIERATRDLDPTGILCIADIASGGGDIAFGLVRHAARSGRAVEVTGFDISETAVALANRRSEAAGAAVTFAQRDALHGPLPTGFDVMTSSLFFHHLADEQIVDLLRRMREADPRAIVINDLVRSPMHLAAAHVTTRLISRSPIVHFDGPASVRAALTCDEIAALAAEAGLAGATVERRFPMRLIVTWCRS